MFAEAYKQATGFTRPVIISRRRADGTCDSSIGSFVIVNDQGWIITAAHIVNEYRSLHDQKVKCEQHAAAVAAIQNDTQVPAKLRQKRLKNLGHLDPKIVTNFSFWWAGDAVKIRDVQTCGAGEPLKSGDVAVARLDPFDPNSVTNYPTFKDPTKPISSGTSLCRLGFPFHHITPTFLNGGFHLPQETFPVVFFPNEGILTRALVVDQNPASFVGFIETSSPGLLGQSGGPIFDQHGTVWAIQSHTSHLPLGFSPPVPGGKSGEKEHQFLNVGRGTHPATIARLFAAAGVKHAVSAY